MSTPSRGFSLGPPKFPISHVGHKMTLPQAGPVATVRLWPMRYSPKFGQGPKVDLSCRKRQKWESTEGSSAQR